MKKQVFILEINDNQNQNWQGNVEWIQGRKKESFRSVMEMLRLIDSVIGEENKEENTIENKEFENKAGRGKEDV